MVLTTPLRTTTLLSPIPIIVSTMLTFNPLVLTFVNKMLVLLNFVKSSFPLGRHHHRPPTRCFHNNNSQNLTTRPPSPNRVLPLHPTAALLVLLRHLHLLPKHNLGGNFGKSVYHSLCFISSVAKWGYHFLSCPYLIFILINSSITTSYLHGNYVQDGLSF